MRKKGVIYRLDQQYQKSLAYLDDVSEHVALKEVSPERPWHLGETKTEGQQEGQPQVVGGHGSIL